jgi:chemotaxis protein methyltransferase CheR
MKKRSTLTGERTPEHQLSDREFEFIRKLVHANTGIALSERKREMVYRRLMRRIHELGIPSFSEYCELLRTPGSEELPHFANAITTNVTSFFRENHHFDYLSDTFLPDLLEKMPLGRRLRIWSAACSTGEEPYSRRSC